MKLALFFTCGVTLRLWVETGLLDREKLTYEEHLKRGTLQKIFWLTYGSDDEKLAQQLYAESRLHPGIRIVQKPSWLKNRSGNWCYSVIMPLLQWRVLKQVDILKTNQMNGSWSAVIAKWLYKKPLVFRTGFTRSLNLKSSSTSRLKIILNDWMEYFAYTYCTKSIVASQQNKAYVRQMYHLENNRVEVIYNCIDQRTFKPLGGATYPDRFVFVGRLSEEKNLFNLIQAISQTAFRLDIYGEGKLRDALEAHARELEANISFIGSVPNKELPNILNRYQYFILPSLYENMPKALLEAMACGLLCVGTDVRGIQEVIHDNVNGILARNPDAGSLVEAIQRVKHVDRDRLSKNAVAKITCEFSLEHIITKEARLFNELHNLT